MIVCVVFFLVLFLAAHPDVTPELLNNVRAVTSGAAPLGGSDEDRFLEKAGRQIYMLQGMQKFNINNSLLNLNVDASC